MFRFVLAFTLFSGLVAPAMAGGTLPALSQRQVLNLEVVKQIAAAAEAEAVRNNWQVSIAIVGEAGQLLHFVRMDDTSNASADIAIAKAKHAANYRRDTQFHENVLSKGNMVVLSLPDSMPLDGGVRLMAGGRVIGGIGVSGVQSPQDAQIARAGSVLLDALPKQ